MTFPVPNIYHNCITNSIFSTKRKSRSNLISPNKKPPPTTTAASWGQPPPPPPPPFSYSTLSYPHLTISGQFLIHSINPNFTTSFLQNSENNYGAFLASQNNSFQAKITRMTHVSTLFYLVIVGVFSNDIIWSANRNFPISESSQLRFTTNGLTLYNETGHPVWSTPQTLAPVSSLQLLESGNLVLLDATANIVWESFDFPTDTLVMGQKLRAGKSLVSSRGSEHLSEGSYRLVIEEDDAVLQWHGMNYWKLSMERRAFRDTNFPAEYLVANYSGVYLVGENGTEIVIQLFLQSSNEAINNSLSFHLLKLYPDGSLSVVTMERGSMESKRMPDDRCRVPAICGALGVCYNIDKCECAPEFRKENDGCVPIDASLALPSSCDGFSEINYLKLHSNLDYFSNDLVDRGMQSVNLSNCQSLCSSNCSCLGVFYSQNSGLCYMIRGHLGSMFNKSSFSDSERLGYIKTISVANPNANSRRKTSGFPVLAVVLPLSLGAIAVALVLTLVWQRRRRKRGRRASNLRREELDWIPDLPYRFKYEEVAAATEGFSTIIGCGGFGTVYKGILEDTTDVAVKKIDSLGAEGKREFLSEIATIGKIRHVNLVKLKGFCVHRGQRFLIYEYMHRGSLDRALFHGETVLGWMERYKIALGTAKGLAYLHTGCEQKIIHCDVKPENILLNDKLEVKVSDFGLSKLLSRELSSFFTTLRGTRGYIAPEWLTNTAISDKTDVYSYGMVLLEIIRGMRNFFSGNSQLINFPLHALEMHMEGRYLELMDPRLMGNAPSEQVEKLVRVALCCVHQDPNLRPSMSNVVRMLEGGMALGEPRIESLTFLRCYTYIPGETAENNEQNECTLQRQEMTSTNCSNNSLSYICSQQVSGPR